MGKKRIISFLAAFLGALLLSSTALAADNLLENSALEGSGIPEPWVFSAYDPAAGLGKAEDGVVTLQALEENDLRLVQRLQVRENTVYTLSSEISADNIVGGRGACLSIDNFAIDGTYIYSAGLTGSSDFENVSLSFRTGEGQTEICAAVRLGGYSEMSRGTALFRALTLTEGWDGVAPILPLTAGGSVPRQAPAQSEELSEAHRIQLKSYLHLFIVISVVMGVVLLFGVYRNREALVSRTLSDSKLHRYFLLSVLAGLILRSVLASLWHGHDTDMSCWMGWGGYIAKFGTGDFYTAPGHEWYDYPPGYMLVLGVIARLLAVFHVPSDSGSAVFAYMLPAAMADIGIALLLMRLAQERGFSNVWCFFLGLLAVFDPAAVVLSGVWGQIDSILTLFLLLTFRELLRDRRITAGVFYGLAIMIKWQALIYGPVLAAAYLLHIRSVKDALDTLLGVLSAICVMLLISLPFKGDQGLFWFVGRFVNAAGGYDYASVEAYNFLALLGGNWVPVSRKLLGPITYRALGLVGIIASVGLALLFQLRDAKANRVPSVAGGSRGVLYLAAAVCMYGIFTFGFYMHERYVFPVIFLLMFAFVETGEDRFLLCSLLLSVIVFLNEITAMYVISDLASSVVRSTREHKAVIAFCSLVETGSFLWFLSVFFDYALSDGQKEAPNAI